MIPFGELTDMTLPSASLERRAGFVSPVVALGSILLATALAPWFSWPANALSDLGAAGRATAPIFNGGLVVAGLLAVPFAHWLGRTAGNTLQRVGGVVFALAAVALALIGLFPTGTALHFPAALSFYLLFTAAMLCHGIGSIRAGAGRPGAATVAIAVVHLVSWAAWIRGVRLGPGLAIPEMIGALIVVGWMAAAARRG